VRILVIDDDRVFREEFSGFLTDEGHTATAVPSLAKAVEALEGGEFEAVFTDLKMPRESGLELLQTVRERWPRQTVIMVTGYATVATAVEAMKLGAFDYIAKPFRSEQVRKVLAVVAEQLRYAGPVPERDDPATVAREIADREKIPVLLAGPGPAPATLRPPVSFVEFDGQDLSRLRDSVESFLHDHPRAGLVLAHGERSVARHRPDDVAAWVKSLRDLLHDRGVLAIGFDPTGLARAQVESFLGAIAAPAVHGTLEALANPIRRRVLARLAEGPTSFSALMHAADLDDSPKMSFHLHRLVEEGLIAHGDDVYRLTAQGEGAARLVHDMETRVGGRAGDAIVFRPKRTGHAS
jgi:ActR/RegA family two-component response regulator/DNA-binding HxlR family transcriptional regulator